MKDRDTYRFMAALRGGSSSFGRILEAVRAAEGLTQDEFGDKLGLTRGRVCDYEKGRRMVTPKMAAAIAKQFGYDPARFIAFAIEESLAKDGLNYTVQIARRRGS